MQRHPPQPFEDMSGCRHPASPDRCDETCACWCDACQERYEAKWAEDTVAQTLCGDCGIPKELTLERLNATSGLHFFLPCDACLPAFQECMVAADLCETCRGPRPPADQPCPRCVCVKQGPRDPTPCTCLQCSYVASRQTPN